MGGTANDDEGENADDATPAGAEELELLAMDAKRDDRGFNVRGKKRGEKGMAKAINNGAASSGEFRVDLEDPRIAKVFSSADFEIDPTNPEFRSSEGMKAVLTKKRHRRMKSQ